MMIRQLAAQDAESYQALRLRSLVECPTAFGASYSEEAARPAAEIAARISPAVDGSLSIFGSFEGEHLVGTLAFVRPLREKLRHYAELCGMYVAPEFRRSGHGAALLLSALDHARSLAGFRQVKLAVTASNMPARALYLSYGFTCVGVEPESLFVDGTYYDSELYVLSLR